MRPFLPCLVRGTRHGRKGPHAMTQPQETPRMWDLISFEDADGPHRGRVVGKTNTGDLVVAGANDQGYRVPVADATVEARAAR